MSITYYLLQREGGRKEEGKEGGRQKKRRKKTYKDLITQINKNNLIKRGETKSLVLILPKEM